jgi:hypothetical protein
MYPNTIDLDEILKYAVDIINEFLPLMIIIVTLFLGLSAVKRIMEVFQTEGTRSWDSDPRNYYLRKFDTVADEIKKLSPSESLLHNLPIYRQSLENISNLNTERTNDASAKILEMIVEIHKQLLDAKSIKLISKNKATLTNLNEELAKLDDNLSALIEVKLEDND